MRGDVKQVSDNFLSGTIPESLFALHDETPAPGQPHNGNMQQLGKGCGLNVLGLAGTRLSGTIPEEISLCGHMAIL